MILDSHGYRRTVGVLGNEEVDALAKKATLLEPNTNIRIPFTDFREQYKLNAYLETKRRNEEQGLMKGREYFELYNTSKSKPWYNSLNLPRRVITTINRCRSNHYNLAASLGRIGIINYTNCACEYHTQDLNHVTWQCPIYDSDRENLIKKLKKCKQYPPYDIKTFLAHSGHTGVANNMRFLPKMRT